MDRVFDDPRWTEFGLFVEAYAALDALIRAQAPDDRPEADRELSGVLIQLVRSPGERLRMTELAKAMSRPPSAITRLVDRCEREGLVERVPCPTDRRVAYAQLTPEGRRVITAQAPQLLAALDVAYFDRLSATERRTLERLLRRLRDEAHQRVCPTEPDAVEDADGGESAAVVPGGRT